MTYSLDNQKKWLLMLKLLSEQGFLFYDGLIQYASFAQGKARKVFVEVSEKIQEGAPIQSVILPLKSMCHPWIYELMHLGSFMTYPSVFYEALISLVEDLDMLEKARKQSLKYPLFMLVLITFVFGVFTYGLLPVYLSLFQGLGIEASKILLDLFLFTRNGLAMATTLFLFIFVLVMSTWIYKKSIKKSIFKRPKSATKLYFYYVLTLKISIYAHQSIPFKHMIDMLIPFETYQPIKQKLITMSHQLNEGISLDKALESFPYAPNTFVMLMSQTTVNNRHETAKRLSEYFKKEYVAVKKQRQKALEPLMLFVIGMLIMVLAYVMYAPLLDVYDAFGQF